MKINGPLDLSFEGDEEEETQAASPLDITIADGEATPVDRNPLEFTRDAWMEGYSRFKGILSSQMSQALGDDSASAGNRLQELERETEKYGASLETQKGLMAMSDAETFGDWLSAVRDHPEAAFHATVSSAGMFAPVLATTAGVNSATGGATAALMASQGFGSLFVEYGATMDETMRENGYDPNDISSWKETLANETVMEEARTRGLKRGIPIAALDAISMGLAGRLLASAKPTATSIISRSAGEIALQGAAGSTGEYGAQLWEHDGDRSKIKMGEIYTEGMLEIGPGLVETAIGYRGEKERAKRREAAEQAKREQVERETPDITPDFEVRTLQENATAIDEALANAPDPIQLDSNEIDPDGEKQGDMDLLPVEDIDPDQEAIRNFILQQATEMFPDSSPDELEAFVDIALTDREMVENARTGISEQNIEDPQEEPPRLDGRDITLGTPGVNLPPVRDDPTTTELEAATEAIEDTGDAVATAGAYRANRPGFEGLVLSFKPGDERNGETVGHYYGEIAETEDADGMPIDVVLNKDADPDADTPVFIVNQNDWDTGKFRQHKVLSGFDSIEAAEQGYAEMWDPKGLGNIHQLTAEEFKSWRDTGNHKVAFNPRAAAQSSAMAELLSPYEESKPDQETKASDITTVSDMGPQPVNSLKEFMESGRVDDAASAELLAALSLIPGWEAQRKATTNDDKRKVLKDYWSNNKPDQETKASDITTVSEDDFDAMLEEASPEETPEPKVTAIAEQGVPRETTSLETMEAERKDLDEQRIALIQADDHKANTPQIFALTTKINALDKEIKAQKKADTNNRKSESAKKRTNAALAPDPTTDDLITFVRKIGGIDTDRESDIEGRLSHLDGLNKTIGLPKIERPGKGNTLDEVAEAVTEAGYMKSGPQGYDSQELINLLFNAEDGNPIWSIQNEEAIEAQYRAEEEKHREADEDQFWSQFHSEVVDWAKNNEEFSQVDPELTQLLSEAMVLDSDRAEDIASSVKSDEEVIQDLREFINEQQTTKQPAAETTADEAGNADREEAIPGQDEPETKSNAPEHQGGVSREELKDIIVTFDDVQERMSQDGWQMHHLFDPPAKTEITKLDKKAGITSTVELQVDKSGNPILYKKGNKKGQQKRLRVYHREAGWMTLEEAQKRIDSWEQNAVSQNGQNSDKIVLSLFDKTGRWSLPWEQAGYDVYRFDIQDLREKVDIDGKLVDPGDVNSFSYDFFVELYGMFEGRDVYAVLAACPCTDFAVSGSQWFGAKDKDGRTVKSVQLVHQTLSTIEYFKPAVWALENPVGRIESLGGLPPWRLSFDPNQMGDPYTKKTLVWGRFNSDLPIAPVDPVEGGKIHDKYGGSSIETKNARSETPYGFSYSFFQANNAIDNPEMAISNQWDRLDRDLIAKAVKAGVTSQEIKYAVEDYYYQELDDDAANEAIQDLIDEKRAQQESEEVAQLDENPGATIQALKDDIGRFIKRSVNDLAGRKNSYIRKAVLFALTGKEVTAKQATISRIRDELYKVSGVTGASEAEKEKNLIKWLHSEEGINPITGEPRVTPDDEFTLAGDPDDISKEQQIRNAEIEKENKLTGGDVPAAQSGNDLFANDGKLEADLFSDKEPAPKGPDITTVLETSRGESLGDAKLYIRDDKTGDQVEALAQDVIEMIDDRLVKISKLRTCL